MIGVGATISIELPAVSDFSDPVEVEITHDQLWLVGVTDLADELAPRVGEIALAVEVIVAERLDPDTVDGTDVVHVVGGRGGLLEPP